VTNINPGWPLKTIDPLLLAGIFNFDWNLDKSRAVTMTVLYLVIIGAGPLMLAFSHWRKRKISAPLGALTLMSPISASIACLAAGISPGNSPAIIH
jgi:hypothetical protein